MGRELWTEGQCEPPAEPHVVELYRDAPSLHRAVVGWIAPGLFRGEGALLVCRPSNAAAVRLRLREAGFDVARLEREDRLILLDATETLRRFLRDGVPHEPSFAAILEEHVSRLRSATGDRAVRAWGEMVDMLWQRGERRAARDLETLWERAIERGQLRLLCSYQMVHGPEDDEHWNLVDHACESHAETRYSETPPPSVRSLPPTLLSTLADVEFPEG